MEIAQIYNISSMIGPIKFSTSLQLIGDLIIASVMLGSCETN